MVLLTRSVQLPAPGGDLFLELLGLGLKGLPKGLEFVQLVLDRPEFTASGNTAGQCGTRSDLQNSFRSKPLSG